MGKNGPKMYTTLKKTVGIFGLDSLLLTERSIQDPGFQISRKVANN